MTHTKVNLKSDLFKAVPLLLLVMVSWCVMTITHELGHVIAGCCSGAHLQKVDLAPWRLPYSYFEPNPYPLITLWGGPILGAALPCVVAYFCRWSRAWFIAYFCVLANGVYLLLAWWSGERFLDTPQLFEFGASRLSVALFCLLSIGIGYLGFRKTSIEIFRKKAT